LYVLASMPPTGQEDKKADKQEDKDGGRSRRFLSFVPNSIPVIASEAKQSTARHMRKHGLLRRCRSSQ
jgi:hypothetical protein